MELATIFGRLIMLMYWPKVLAETMISTTLEVPAMVSSMMEMKCFLKLSCL